ncbi:hypothetical protein [Erwinia typographi]|uniref:hypothetical protein n=1 Tax=Erwinia typographi TaxID=371042 RepID=UPI00069244D4|nr:hypothetical protein [Erwinia typographi]
MTSVNDIKIERIDRELQEVTGKVNHLLIRSELTLYVLSVMIEAGVVKREGVEELINNATFNAPGISPAIIRKEKEIVLANLNKVKIS